MIQVPNGKIGVFALSEQHVDEQLQNIKKAVVVFDRLEPTEDGNKDFHMQSLVTIDHDVINDVKKKIGVYADFAYQEVHNAIEAYKASCYFYHRFKWQGMHDVRHPKVPEGYFEGCPICGL